MVSAAFKRRHCRFPSVDNVSYSLEAKGRTRGEEDDRRKHVPSSDVADCISIMSNRRETIGGLSIAGVFYDFVETELLPAIGFDSEVFWSGVAGIVDDLSPINRELLQVRDNLQKKIDAWHKKRKGGEWKPSEYLKFLTSIGYIKSSDEFPAIDTVDVDPEIAEIAGPQLVVPEW